MGRGGTPAREISFFSLVAYGPNSDSALTMGGNSLWNQAGRFPTDKKIVMVCGWAEGLLLGPLHGCPQEASTSGYTRGTQIWNVFIKNCVLILTCLNFSQLRSTLHLMQYTYWDFFPLLKQFLNCLFWCFLVFLPFFCFTSSTSVKHFPLSTFFHLEEKKKLLEVRSCEWGGRGIRSHAVFGHIAGHSAQCKQGSS